MIVPCLAAIAMKVWDMSHTNEKANRDLMIKILLQLERHESLFSSIQEDIHELKEKF